jgi:hypothetical protein
MTTRKIAIPDDAVRQSADLGRRRNRSAEEIVRDTVRKRPAAGQLRALSAEIRPLAEARGFDSEDDILKSFS